MSLPSANLPSAYPALPVGKSSRRVVIPETDRDEIVNIAAANRWSITRPFTNCTIYRRRMDEIRVLWRSDGTARFAGKNLAKENWGVARGAMCVLLVKEWMEEPDWLMRYYQKNPDATRKKWWEEDN